MLKTFPIIYYILAGSPLLMINYPCLAACTLSPNQAGTWIYPTDAPPTSISDTAALSTTEYRDYGKTPSVSPNWVSSGCTTTSAGYKNNIGTNSAILKSTSTAGGAQATTAWVYPITNVPGLGYALVSGNNEILCGGGTTNFCQPFGNIQGVDITNNNASGADLRLRFYIIGTLTAGQYTIPSNLGSVYFGTNIVMNALLAGPVTVNITHPCTISTTNIAVSLGTQKANQFVNVGDASTPSAFDINLTGCSASSVHINITGTADPNYTNAANNGVLATTGGATGVGIQLRRRDTNAVMKLNQDNTWTSSYTSGSLTLPLEARYIKNNMAVTAGQANATATFTMSYP